MPVGSDSWLDTLKASTNDAVDTSKFSVNVNSWTESLSFPTINIFSPSSLNATPVGESSFLSPDAVTVASISRSLLAYDAVDTSKFSDNVYWYIESFWFPTINIFSPSSLNAKAWGSLSWLDTLKASTNDAVPKQYGPPASVYSFTSSPVFPVTNIFLPSSPNVMPWGVSSWLVTLLGDTSVQLPAVLGVDGSAL